MLFRFSLDFDQLKNSLGRQASSAMYEVPECLNRRYKAFDELIQELRSTSQKSTENSDVYPENSEDPGIKLMCDFWNILKEDPDCDLPVRLFSNFIMNTSTHLVYPDSSDDSRIKLMCEFWNNLKEDHNWDLPVPTFCLVAIST